MTEIKELQAQIYKTAKEHGWWDDFDTMDRKTFALYVSSKLALIHSEVSEALEELRKNPMSLGTYFEDRNDKPEGFSVELADAVIRIMDLCSALDIDLEKAIRLKMAYNEKRSHKHGGKAI